MRLVCAPLSEKEGMEELAQRFRRLPRQLLTANLELDPSLNENLEQWPHLNELTHCYKADWVKDNSKYGHYETVGNTSFQNQVFEGPDTDIGTEMRLSNARHFRNDDATDDDIPSTSGWQLSETSSSDAAHTRNLQQESQTKTDAETKQKLCSRKKVKGVQTIQ
ncbi:guanine nucleotide exchange factor SPIKE 1-like isoform X1 [Nymphaea colorata]|nr:guanine nucleotide exchange factor SPIKE 1-like isoform X1 [Nymphaea colorata]